MENKNISKVLIIGEKTEEVEILERVLNYLAVSHETKQKIAYNQSLSKQGYVLLFLFDVKTSMMPLEVCRAIREIDPYILINYFSYHNNPDQKILAFELGVDQFISLPTTEIEIMVRLRSQLRRANSFLEFNEIKLPDRFLIKDLEINTLKKEVILRDQLVPFTPSEYKILEYLALTAGQTISRSMIAHKIWGYDSDIYEENIKCHISRIRKKIEPDPHNPNYIKTIRGIGYRMLEAKQIFVD